MSRVEDSRLLPPGNALRYVLDLNTARAWNLIVWSR